MTDEQKLAAARERIRRWTAHNEHWQKIYPDARDVREAYELARFDRQMIDAVDSVSDPNL